MLERGGSTSNPSMPSRERPKRTRKEPIYLKTILDNKLETYLNIISDTINFGGKIAHCLTFNLSVDS